MNGYGMSGGAIARGGFHEPRKLSPTGLTLVIGMHAAALGALALIKGPEIVEQIGPTIVDFIEAEKPEPDPPPEPQPQRPRQRQVADSTPTPIQRPTDTIIVDDPQPPPTWNVDPPVEEVLPPTRVDPPPPPVRIDAEFDPRFADDFLPPYPPARERAEQEGRVRVRLTIGIDGRVKSVVRLSATHEDFWNATERHVRNRWRFRPATLDGRPVESSKTMTINFELEDA